MLASLAVLVACSLGATALPLGPAAAAQAAPRFAVDPAGALTLRTGAAVSAPVSVTRLAPRAGAAGWSGADQARVADRAGADRIRVADRAGVDHDGAVDRVGGGVDRARATDRAGSAERQVAPVGVPDPVVPRRAVAVPVDRQSVLVGLVPATVGSRAPPAR
ncbi:hypothetical protein GA0070604_1725 [Micromonospora eburnea]|uniref:Uncharacterized protein n=2 Tax=Micromonospora eburnea TaxID=227316 RepID=A0A1C6U3A4_9ACTN|nr:hypothetical protein GA0070604_1725 [Micromonospora eburnea]